MLSSWSARAWTCFFSSVDRVSAETRDKLVCSYWCKEGLSRWRARLDILEETVAFQVGDRYHNRMRPSIALGMVIVKH